MLTSTLHLSALKLSWLDGIEAVIRSKLDFDRIDQTSLTTLTFLDHFEDWVKHDQCRGFGPFQHNHLLQAAVFPHEKMCIYIKRLIRLTTLP